MKKRILIMLVILAACAGASGCVVMERIDERVQTARENYLEIRAAYLEIRTAYLASRESVLLHWDEFSPEVREILVRADAEAERVDRQLRALDQQLETTYLNYEEINRVTLLTARTIRTLSESITLAAAGIRELRD